MSPLDEISSFFCGGGSDLVGSSSCFRGSSLASLVLLFRAFRFAELLLLDKLLFDGDSCREKMRASPQGEVVMNKWKSMPSFNLEVEKENACQQLSGASLAWADDSLEVVFFVKFTAFKDCLLPLFLVVFGEQLQLLIKIQHETPSRDDLRVRVIYYTAFQGKLLAVDALGARAHTNHLRGVPAISVRDVVGYFRNAFTPEKANFSLPLSFPSHDDSCHDSSLGISGGPKEFLVLVSDQLADLVCEAMSLGSIVIVELSAHHVTSHRIKSNFVEVNKKRLREKN